MADIRFFQTPPICAASLKSLRAFTSMGAHESQDREPTATQWGVCVAYTFRNRHMDSVHVCGACIAHTFPQSPQTGLFRPRPTPRVPRPCVHTSRGSLDGAHNLPLSQHAKLGYGHAEDASIETTRKQFGTASLCFSLQWMAWSPTSQNNTSRARGGRHAWCTRTCIHCPVQRRASPSADPGACGLTDVNFGTPATLNIRTLFRQINSQKVVKITLLLAQTSANLYSGGTLGAVPTEAQCRVLFAISRS